MKTELDILKDDYTSRLKTVMQELNNGGNDLTINRLGTKASCYRTLLAEINKLESSSPRPVKPDKKNFGYVENDGFDSEPAGWVLEDGEEAYNKAMQKWIESSPRPVEDGFKEKLELLLTGLETRNIDKFISEVKKEDYLNYGKAYINAVRKKVDKAFEDGKNSKAEHMDVSEQSTSMSGAKEQPESKAEGSAENVYNKMIDIMPYSMLPHCKPYVINAMHEFASLREVKLPDRDKSWTIFISKYGKYHGIAIEVFDYYESELKRLNKIK